jgi:hypothetical protein
VLCVLVGAFLRVRGISWQIPIDDEWHGLDFALTRDAWFLLTHFSRAGANSVAFNVCLRGLLVTLGWSEITIVLPSLLAGVALLWFFPSWIRRRFGAEAAVVSAALLAIAPFLIAYSRTARVYSALLLFECLALVALAEWLRTAERRHAVVWVGFGALSIWSHLTALPLLFAAVATAAARRAWLHRKGATPEGPRARDLLVASAIMLALAGALWLPPLLHALPSPVHGAAHFSVSTFVGLTPLLCGTARLPVQIVVGLVALLGMGLAARAAREEMLLFAAALAGVLLVVVATRTNSAGYSGVLARYLLPLFPLVSLAIGVAAQTALRRARTARRRCLCWGAVAALLAALYAAGPLPRIYAATNSFSKHPALQFDYAEHDPDSARPDPLEDGAMPGLHRSQLQPFYARLASEGGSAPVIEYPFLLGRNLNLFYFAQQVHHRPVFAGYYHSGVQDEDRYGFALGPRRTVPAEHLSPGYIMDNMTIDHVFGRGQRNVRIRFRTVVDILDEAAVKRSRAEYLILHGNILQEFFHWGPERTRGYFVGRILAQLAARYGAPVFDNDFITVFRLSGRR